MAECTMIGSRADRILGMTAAAFAASAGAGLVGDVSTVSADIVYSGIQNINIPSNFDGVYLNVITGATGTSGAGTPGWDINPYGSTSLLFFTPATGGLVRGEGSSTSLVDNLAPGFEIGPSATANWGGGSVETSGSTAFNLNSPENIVGFRFVNEDTALTHYGWMRFALSDSFFAQPRTIVDWAYNGVAGASIQAAAVPEPSSVSLLALGAMGVLARRRRVNV